MRNLIAVLFAGLLVASCAPTPTPYQSYHPHQSGGIHGGYTDKRLKPDELQVRFHGNSMTSRERVEGYMLYRAAELTLADGFDWFLVAERNTEHKIRTVVEPNPSYHPPYGAAYGGWQPDWRHYSPGSGWSEGFAGWDHPATSDRVNVRRIEAFEATADILLRKGPIPAAEPRAFDARRVIADLGPTVERPRD